MPVVVSKRRFAEVVARELEINRQDLVDDARLVEDLGLDSFQLFRLLIVVEILSELDVPLDVAREVSTFGEVYNRYAQACLSAS